MRHAPDTIRIGLVGCGGRGRGAVRNALAASPAIEIVALGDLFPDRVASAREQFAEAAAADPVFKAGYRVTDQNCHVGFDAIHKVLASDIDLVILATPPAFRPAHFEAAVAAGKHIFTEKPVAVDVTGALAFIAAAERARAANLAVVAGTQRRHDPHYIETIARLHEGAIGDILSGQVWWNQGGLWNRPRETQWTDVEFQLRNWLYFTWASGDHIVEQHVHNIDVANWVLGGHPVRVNGVGGRQVRTGPEYGHIYDHFCVEMEYANGARVTSMCRQQDGTEGHVGEFFLGTAGTSNGADTIRGATAWRYDGEQVNPYQQEHTNLIASIRAGQPINEGRQIAESNLTAIMVREAAYTGQAITWDQAMASNLSLVPENVAFGDMPVAPVAMPGVTQLERPMYGHSHAATSQAGR